MAYKVSEYAGVAGQVAGVLKSLGIVDSDQLLMLVTDPAQRADLLNKLGVDDRFLTDLTERADLTRLPGVGPAYAELLSKAGIRSVGALAAAVPAALLDTLTKTAATFGIKKLPTEADLTNWTAAAKKTPDLVTWSTGVRVDATKKLFAEDEWTKIRLAPLAAASLVMLASPSKGDDAAAEAQAAVANVDATRVGSSAWSLLNVAFPQGVTAAEMQKFINETPPAAMMSTIKSAADAVTAKAPDQAAAFRAMLMQVATGVAEASKEGGFLGMGKKVVSDEEAAALADLRLALGL
jgi:hypothetical protein